jgi:hypothetical protein
MNPGPPAGAGGKHTRLSIRIATDRCRTVRWIVLLIHLHGVASMRIVGRESTASEILLLAEKNLERAQRRADPNWIEIVFEDEALLDEHVPSPPSTPCPSHTLRSSPFDDDKLEYLTVLHPIQKKRSSFLLPMHEQLQLHLL